jgi:hypothetical protein
MNETWRPVVGFEGLYEVSDQGRVRTLGRVDARGRRRQARLLKTGRSARGYVQVGLTPRGAGNEVEAARTFYVHSLVLEAFVGPRPEGMDACHGNDVPWDNRLVNLRWDTRFANFVDRVRLQARHTSKRSRVPQRAPVPPGQCRRRHEVVGPNAARRANGRRDRCVACLRAHSEVNYARCSGVVLDFGTVADRRYAELMRDYMSPDVTSASAGCSIA